jgi:hypothetical protein
VNHLAEERPTKGTRLDEEEADNSTSLSASLKSTPALQSTTIELLPLPPVVVEPPESSQPAPKLPDGTNIQKDTSLHELVANWADFENEETLLQTKGWEMGVLVDQTPKCHCELVGEGIEYSWGCAKNVYWRQPLKMKRGKESFRSTV